MADQTEPVKIKFEYKNPDDVEAEVPGAQILREANADSEVSSSDTFHEEPVIVITKSEATFTKGDLKLQKVTVTEDISMTFQYLFKKEAMPGKQVPQKSKPRRQNSLTGSQGPGKDHGKLSRTPSKSNDKDKTDDKKIKTKIPVSRFRQTVEKVQMDRRGSKDYESHIPIRRSSIPKASKAPTKPIRKSLAVVTKTEVTEPVAAPIDEFDKLYDEVVHSPTPINIDESLLNPKVDDPEKLESKFEEIIHDYEEHPVLPIDVEMKKSKIPFLKRRSQQELAVEGRSDKISAAREKVRMRYSADLSDVKAEESDDNYTVDPSNSDVEYIKADDTVNAKESDDRSESDNKNDGKTEIGNDITVDDENNVKIEELVNNNIIVGNEDENYPIPTENATSLKHNEENDITKVVGRRTVTEVITSERTIKENTKGQVTEEIIQKDFIKIGIPVYEHTEKIETQKTVEVKNVLSYTSNNDDLQLTKFEANVEIIEINNEPVITEMFNNAEQSIVEIVDTCETPFISEIPEVLHEIQEIEATKTVMKEKDSSTEDLAKRKGKVDRLITKIGSHEPIKAHENLANEVPEKKSVLSKIAMFERHEAEPVIKSKIPKNDTKLPKLLTSYKQKTENVHVHTPLIVDEVFKPFEATTDSNVTVNKVEITTNGDDRDVTEIVRAEMVFIKAPETVLYNTEAKVQIESNALFIEQTKIAEEVLTPVLRKQPKDEIENKNDKKLNFKLNKSDSTETPVIVPKYIPVKEVLKRYESINSDTLVNNKSVEDLPKTRPISEIISALKPDASHRSLDAMFAHQPTPANDILNVLKPESVENIAEHNLNNNDEVFQSYETRHQLKSFKSRDGDYKTIEGKDDNFKSLQFIQDYHHAKVKNDDLKRARSLAELDLGDAVKGKVNKMIGRINSVDIILDNETKDAAISLKEMPRKRSVSEKIALFERKLIAKEIQPARLLKREAAAHRQAEEVTADIQAKIAELSAGKLKYGKVVEMPRIMLANGVAMPCLAVGTALLDPRLAFHIVSAAIDLGYRAIDTAYIYGNEKVVGEAIRAKIADGTVTREELFIISKLWSTYHRTDLVKVACEASLAAMGLDYFDLYLIHNPMSFKEGGAPIPKIATVLQYSEYEYLDAWFGLESLGSRARALGVSNFNSAQIKRVLDRARVKPVVNQVECHPYLSQQRLDDFCGERNITLSCFGVLGSKGTPVEFKSGNPVAIDDALVQVMASGLNVSPAQLLIRYQLECGHQVVVKSSSAAHMWDNLQALTFTLTSGQVDALHSLNRNKRIFTFNGMGDTHKNYPFKAPF